MQSSGLQAQLKPLRWSGRIERPIHVVIRGRGLEVVDRPGWQSNNALLIIITGSGCRTAEAYDNDPDEPALLLVEYTVVP